MYVLVVRKHVVIIQIILLLDRHSSHRLSETMYKARVVISNINNMHPSFTAMQALFEDTE